jgi:transcriptional regulator with XRE-family HTH domain
MDSGILGKIIRNRRKEKKVTQEELNQLCSLGNRFLSELERGKEGAKLGLVLKVLQRLNLDIIIVPSHARTMPEYRALAELMNEYVK